MNPHRRSYMAQEIFSWEEQKKIKESNRKKQYKKPNGIDLVTEILKLQNMELLKNISKKKNIDLEDLLDKFYKVSYYTPLIVYQKKKEITEKEYIIKKIEHKTKAHQRKQNLLKNKK